MIALTLSGRVAASYGPNEDRDADKKAETWGVCPTCNQIYNLRMGLQRPWTTPLPGGALAAF